MKRWHLLVIGVWFLAACARGVGEPAASLTPATRPSTAVSLLTQTATPSVTATGPPAATPAAPAYPAPGGGLTTVPTSPTQISPTPDSPPPYPGPVQSTAETATSLPPPYPGGAATPVPSPTLVPTGPPALTPTSSPTEAPTPVSTPTATSTPTRTPGLRPTVVAAEYEPGCMTEEGLTTCHDPFLMMDFVYPAVWGEIVLGDLRPEATGALYTYEIQGSLRGEGRSGDFIPPLESSITAFPGFYSELLAERCEQFSPAQICEEVQPQVVLVLVFPEARGICNPVPGDLFSPLAILAINLPDHPTINGFVFYGGFLSPAQEARLAEYRAELLGLPDGRGCTLFLRSRFNVRVLEMIAGVRNDRLDENTAENVRRWFALGESIQVDE